MFWVAIWAIAAAFFDKPLLLPTPTGVAARIYELSILPDFWHITALSLLRITAGILAAILLGIVVVVLTHKSKLLHELLSPILIIIKTTPVASFIILVLIWLGRDIVPAVISAMMVFPVICNNVSTGLHNLNPEFLEMAEVYHLSKYTCFKRITFPTVMPYFLSALQTSIGVGWKAGIAAEVLTVPAHSIGKMIFDSKMYMETTDLFAWTIIVIFISLVIETLVIRSIKRLGSKYSSEVMNHD